jgi:hypothetical protein
MRKLALALAMAVFLAAVSAQPAAAATRRTCAMKGTRTVAASSYARVFTRTWTTRLPEPVKRLYACVHSVNRRIWLDSWVEDEYTSDTFGDFALNGRYVGWRHSHWDDVCKEWCDPGYSTITRYIRVIDLRTRRTRSLETMLRLGSLQVTRGGTATWLDDRTGEQRSAVLH